MWKMNWDSSLGGFWSHPREKEVPEVKWWDGYKGEIKMGISINLKEHIERLRANPFPLDKFRCNNTNNLLQGPAQGIVHVRNSHHSCSPFIRTFLWRCPVPTWNFQISKSAMMGIHRDDHTSFIFQHPLHLVILPSAGFYPTIVFQPEGSLVPYFD